MRALRSPGNRPVLATLAGPVAAAAVVAVVAWVFFLVLKGVIVVATYAVGIALLVVPWFFAGRLLAGTHGRERWRRVGGLAVAVLLGALLCVIAHAVRRHGWLIVALPAALIGVSRLLDRVAQWRLRRRTGPRVIEGTRVR